MKLLVIMTRGNLVLNILRDRDERYDYPYQAMQIAKHYYPTGWKFVQAFEIQEASDGTPETSKGVSSFHFGKR